MYRPGGKNANVPLAGPEQQEVSFGKHAEQS
jgi:hypothetical protein